MTGRRGLPALRVLVAMAVVGVSRPASAESLPGCEGCVLYPVTTPDASLGSPLLVTLHGDIDHAPTTAARWRVAAKERGVIVLGIECPRALGCDKGSFWRWNGAPAYLEKQVEAVRAKYPLDARRIYLSGWSGGASYMGWHASRLPKIFAALVHHGGGVAPNRANCPSEKTPVYFLVGAQNPLHKLAQDLRDYYTHCGHEVKWDLVPNAGHPEELAALDTARAGRILDWLVARPLRGGSSDAGGDVATSASGLDADAGAGADDVGDAGKLPRAPELVDDGRVRGSPTGRGCALAGTARARETSTVLAVLGCVAWWHRRRRAGVNAR